MAGFSKKSIISKQRKGADIRPWDEKAQEWLSISLNMAIAQGVLCSLCFFIAPLAPFFLITGLIIYKIGNSMKLQKLPFRYPVLPADTPARKAGKENDGIMLLGQIDSDSPSENFKAIWLNNDWMRRHWLILGATGSGKTETLKGIFFNALCWGSGFFCADGKADNSLPTDGMTMATAFGRIDDVLVLNFLLGGKSPQSVARSRRKRSNGINPFADGDADTLIQMGVNLLPKAEGDGKKWQDYAIALWRAVITALVYERDTMGIPISVGRIIDSLSLTECERIYIDGYKQAQIEGDWSYGYNRMKNYLESGLSGYQVEKLLQKKGLTGDSASAGGLGRSPSPMAKRGMEQDSEVFMQHGYRTSQLTPALDLLDKTYGYIFSATYPEIDMVDVALQNRILFLLIPSLEKSAQEAESLGKLAIACLRVMMARNLGADVEGTREELRESRATNAEYPYIVALDELGYYFADGIAVMFAQARSLGMSMIALGQDLEMLTRGERSAEAGAMIGNAVLKLFMKIDDSGKTYDLVSKTLGEVYVASQQEYEDTKGSGNPNFRRTSNARIEKEALVSFQELSEMNEGEAYFNAKGKTERIKTLYLGPWFDKLNGQEFSLNRFLQIPNVEIEDLSGHTIKLPTLKDKNQLKLGQKMMSALRGDASQIELANNTAAIALERSFSAINKIYNGANPIERGALGVLALESLLSAPGAMSGEPGIDDVVPIAAKIMHDANQSGESSVAAAFDEHGMPDPLALIRKPINEVLATARPEPDMVIKAPGTLTSKPELEDEDQLIKPVSFDGFEGFEEDDEDDEQKAVDDMMSESYANKRDISQPAPAAKWALDALMDANKMKITPRSVNGTAVGLSEDSMNALADLEDELGSVAPQAAAKSMQKIAAAQITPNTIGATEAIPEEEIDDFFSAL